METTELLKLIVLIVIGVWEVIARLIPTVENWAGTAVILRILTAISDFLNRTKKQTK